MAIFDYSSLTDGVSSSVIVIVTFSEKDRSIRPNCSSLIGRFEIILVAVLKVLQGMGQLDSVLPLYKFLTFSRYSARCLSELYEI